MTDRSRRAAHADPARDSEDLPEENAPQPDGTRGRDAHGEDGGASDAGGERGGRSDRGGMSGRNGTDDRNGRSGRRSGDRRNGRDGEDSGDNPFAPPPEGAPDRPWQPRRRHARSGEGGASGDAGDDGGRRGRWSRDQPRRHEGGFGGPGRPEQGDGDGGRRTPGLRWDPSDPKQRHARYALHGGIWGLFFALFGMIEIALLLGALSVYWGISALRGPSGLRGSDSTASRATAADVSGTDGTPGAPGRAGSDGNRPGGVPVAVTPAQAAKARKTAAIGGLVAGVLTLLGVAANFTQQMVYEEFYACRQDALTQAARDRCEELPDGQVPPWLPMTEGTTENE